MKVLNYNPGAGTYEVLPTENQRKGRLIEDINTIQLHIGKRPIDAQQFEALMECDIEQLTRIVNDQADVIERTKCHL